MNDEKITRYHNQFMEILRAMENPFLPKDFHDDTVLFSFVSGISHDEKTLQKVKKNLENLEKKYQTKFTVQRNIGDLVEEMYNYRPF